ncbi:MAG: TetR/AcrR family transcriptional regulator [bacterium]|nr:TetR/AcrR family transcriptional regulator [bacterium]
MIKTRQEKTSDSTERIIEAATVLFARKGFHGVSTRELAAEVGLNIATVNYHVGGKQALYQEVFRRTFAKERELLQALIGEVPDAVVQEREAFRQLLETIVESSLNLTREHPEIAQLYVRRWLDQDTTVMENYHEQFSIPLYQMIRDLLERAQAAGTVDVHGLDLGIFLQSFSWMVYGYFLGEPIDFHQRRRDPFQPENIEQFKRFLCDYIGRMIKLA